MEENEHTPKQSSQQIGKIKVIWHDLLTCPPCAAHPQPSTYAAHHRESGSQGQLSGTHSWPWHSQWHVSAAETNHKNNYHTIQFAINSTHHQCPVSWLSVYFTCLFKCSPVHLVSEALCKFCDLDTTQTLSLQDLSLPRGWSEDIRNKENIIKSSE